MKGDIKHLLIIPHIKIHNANALSSPFTIGFPAMSAWLGAVHALQRQLNQQTLPVQFVATGVVSHNLNLQTYKGENDFVHSIISTGNPLDKTGARPAFIEEARCHVEVSLLIEYEGLIEKEERDRLLELCQHLLMAKMKIAGGDIQSFDQPYYLANEEGNPEDLHKLQRALMPGHAILERRELMKQAMEEGADALEALIDYLAIHHQSAVDDQGNVQWTSHRKAYQGKSPGWIVPIATGFHAISEPAQALNQRDPDTPHRFAEAVVTLGEFKMPHRIQKVEDMLWRYHHEDDLYLCQQTQLNQLPESDLSDIEYSEF